MTCKRISERNRQEQDYWLSFTLGHFYDRRQATEEERLSFLRYDSHGGEVPLGNPVLLGKIRHGQAGEVLRDAYFAGDVSWVGGISVIASYIDREPFQYRPLVEWFGSDAVERWLEAWWNVCEREELEYD